MGVLTDVDMEQYDEVVQGFLRALTHSINMDPVGADVELEGLARREDTREVIDIIFGFTSGLIITIAAHLDIGVDDFVQLLALRAAMLAAGMDPDEVGG